MTADLPAAVGNLVRRRPRGTRAEARTASGLWALAPEIDVDGPRVRLGLAWAALTVLAVVLGPVATALVFGVVALGAAGQATRSWRRSGVRPYRPVAVGGATLAALAGSAGPLAVLAAAVVATVAAVTAQQLRFGGRDWDARSTAAIAVLVGVGAASPALVVDLLGLVPAVVLLATVHAVDASTFIVGSGARSKWEGPVAAAASAAALSVLVAAVFVPPFRGASPWVLGGLVAVLVPAGTMAATTLLGDRGVPVPVLRRLDAYLVAGPVWALAGRLLLG